MDFLTMMTKGSEFQWDHDSEFQWQEDAACRFQPYTLFEIASPEDAIAEGLDVNEIKDLNDANFKRAGEICSTCPVFSECDTSASKADFAWTFRAGKVPSNFNPNLAGRPASEHVVSLVRPKNYKKRNNPHKPCRNCGVKEWYEKKKSNGSIVYRCHNCDRIRKGASKHVPLDTSKPCLKCGEMDWGVRRDGDREYNSCKACMRFKKNKTYWAKKGMLIVEPTGPCPKGHDNWIAFKAKTLTVYRCQDC